MTEAALRKKLIEVSIPLEAINKASAREKSIRHGHPSTLHLWWARRPLAACRAILFAQLVDDPSAWPEKFPTEAEQEVERLRLHRVIEKMIPWEASNDEAILKATRWEIARSVAWGLGEEPPAKGDGKAILAYLREKAPPVYDPFSGGGSIPLEAQRLGLRAYGSDLNPIAVLIGKALVEIPPKFAGRPPVNPKSQAELKRGGRWNSKGAEGLAEDVRYYGQWLRDEAEKLVGHLYPKAQLADGSEATVIAWLWARTVRSPDPAAQGTMVPLVSSFMLSGKEGKKAWVEPVIDTSEPHGWRFEVRLGKLSAEEEVRLKNGTKTGGGGTSFFCIKTGTGIPFDYIRAEGKAGRIGSRLMAVVAGSAGHRSYLSPTASHEHSLVPDWDASLDADLPERALGFRVQEYGMKKWSDLFTARQITMLNALSTLIGELKQVVAGDCQAANFIGDNTRLSDEGSGPVAYADAIATYLAFAIDKVSEASTTICTWSPLPTKLHVVTTFGRQAIPMVWDYAESNPFAESSGNILRMAELVSKALAFSTAADANLGSVVQRDAAANHYPASIVISSDPPYYDNIGYADLSDFFYVRARQSLAEVWPDLFRRLLTPKTNELIATPFRHSDRNAAEAFFMNGMSRALRAMRMASADQPLTIYYAFKQSEIGEDGVTSAGWASFLQAVVDAGLVVDGTWPVRTERAGGFRNKGANALASSIVLVCRKSVGDRKVVDRAGFSAALRRELPAAIANIRAAGVGPVDMQQSMIGPGMGVFTRYSEVLEDDDSKMKVKTALSIINRIWEEIDNEIVASFDPETQVALAWFSSYGFEPKTSGELITLANAKDTSINDLFDSHVFEDHKGRTALTARDRLDPRWSPASDRQLTVWECVQHLARTLNAEEGGAQAAARLIAEMGPKATDARALLDRLFQIATDKGWAQEALVYNQLAEEWPHLLERSTNISGGLRPSQTGDLFA